MQKLVIFDTETTGIELEDKIIQVGAIVAELGNPKYSVEVYDELCSSEIPIKIEAMSTHGIRQEDIDNKTPFSETKFKKRFDELNIESNYLIAHNIDFDRKMIEKEGYENKILYKLIDTLQCAKHIYDLDEEINGYKLPNYKLQTFRYMMFSHKEEELEAKKYNVEIKAHDAIGDVVILKMFLAKLYSRVGKKYQINNPKEIFDKMVELTKLPVEVKKINFGKHKGKSIIEINSIDPDWIDWLYSEQVKQKESNDPKFNRDLHFTLNKTIENRSTGSNNINDGINF